MSDAVLVALIVSIPSTIVAFANIWLQFRNGRKVEEIHKATNSMKDELVAATRAAALLTGAAEERARHTP